MSKLLTIAILTATAMTAAADTETLDFKARIKENGNVLIRGFDGVEREAVLITPAEYASLTNAMIYLSGVKEYREKIHGKVVSRVADAETKTVAFRYEDGFVWSEPMRLAAGTVSRPAPLTRVDADAKPRAMTETQWRVLKMKRAAKKPREYNAVFGPGGKEVK